jgi:phenylacetate-coenzyme A ligase PaaK-like adenylate-forming protein
MQFPTRQTMAAEQLAQLRRLLAAVMLSNAFYRKKFAGIHPGIASLEEFTTRIPFTTKQELVEDQRAAPPFGTNLTFPPSHYTRYHQTSGTNERAVALAGHARELERHGQELDGGFPGGGDGGRGPGLFRVFVRARSSDSGWHLTRRNGWAACACRAGA